MPIDKLPHGKYGCTGHVINLLQDYHLPSELDVIVFIKNSAKQQFNSLQTGNIIKKVNL